MLDKNRLNQLYRYALSLTRNEDQAYDLLQQCVEKFLRTNSAQIKEPEAYIKRSIRNAFIDQCRGDNKLLSLSDLPDAVEKINQTSSDSLETLFIQQRDVEQLLKLLSAEESELLYLWAIEEYSMTEIAEIQGVPRGTLLSKMHRLKKRVQLELTEEQWVPKEAMQ
ncbi:RNA polymerase sigma factor [Neptuniibacter sp. QD72_48]|uniref:RNA polymerase sigma factor n=1 Tax=unclassified Neptuniibacter TaxID=2630693 RepID=UPI0039F70745